MRSARLRVAIATASFMSLLSASTDRISAQQPPAGAQPVPFSEHAGFTSLFDGKTLTGWDGATDVWHVQDGVIVAESTPQRPTGTTFLIWRGGEPSDFDLKLEIKVEGQGGNSGIQYRSRNVPPDPNFNVGRGRAGAPPPAAGAAGRGPAGPAPNPEYTKWNMQGYQADFDLAGNMAGQMFEGGRFPGERGITTRPGQVVALRAGQPAVILATLATLDDLKATFRAADWNQYEVVARGYTFFHFLNGRLVSGTIDDDPMKRAAKGLIGLQIEGNNLKVSFRDIWLKTM